MVGTRGGLGRVVAMVVGLVICACLLLAGTARAGTYKVAQCGWGVGVELDPTAPRTEGVGASLRPGYCNRPVGGSPAGVEFEIAMANVGEPGVARARWAAPPGTNFAGVRFTWSGDLAPGIVQFAGFDDDTGFNGMAAESGHTPPHVAAQSVTGPVPAFEVFVRCLLLGSTFGCDRSFASRAQVSDVTLTVADPVPPQARLGGTLAGAGWHRGRMSVEVGGEDRVGAGVYAVAATVDGATVLTAPVACAVAAIEGEVRATRLQPCPATASGTGEVDTAALADGVHALRGCAVDFGGGWGCAPEVQVQVDNSPPGVEFAAAPEGQVAAVVTDAFSGPAAGTIAVRRGDSDAWTDLPTALERGGAGVATLRAQLPDLGAGAFFFRAVAADGAGNSGSAQFRAAGSAAEVRRVVGTGGSARPRGRATRLEVHLVGSAPEKRGRRAAAEAGDGRRELTVLFGTAVEVRGRLTDARGDAIPSRAVAVVARPTAGAGAAPRRWRVVTDRAGRFALRLPPGTSRRVVVSFRGGGGLASVRARPWELRVRAAVSLVASPLRLRTGESVTLTGRVRPGEARIPARGKLVTIQYLERASGRWRPALVVRTGARGRFKARYRFRYVTGAARIRLRATALPEAGWPYAAGSSPPIMVEVRGR